MKQTKWVNVYQFGVGIHDSPEKAEEVASGATNNKLVARVRIEFEEGQMDGQAPAPTFTPVQEP